MCVKIHIIPATLLMAALACVSFGATEERPNSKALKILNRKIVVFRSHTAPRTPRERVTEAKRQPIATT
jgi:hypothetical protein